MSDRALRRLEQQARASGAADDRAAWLRAAVRAGALEPERLRALAWLGDPGAVAAAEAQVDPRTGATTRAGRNDGPVTPGDLRAWGRALGELPGPFGQDLLRRALAADLARAAATLEAASAQSPGPGVAPRPDDPPPLVRVLWRRHELVGDWALRPEDEGRRRAVAALADERPLATLERPSSLGPTGGRPGDAGGRADLAARAADLAAVVGVGEAEGATVAAAALAAGRTPPAFGRWWSGATGDLVAHFASIRAALAAELAPWVEGAGDPLVERTLERALARAKAGAARRGADGEGAQGASAEGAPGAAPADPLARLHVASPCPLEAEAAWASLRGDGPVRWCPRCVEPVFDLAGLAREDALALLAGAAGGRLCARLYVRPDGRVLTRDCAPGLEERVGSLPRAFDRVVMVGRLGG